MRAIALTLETTDRSGSPVFERFFAGYERAFTLPDETESREGFGQCLALNHGPDHARLAALYGRFRELCLVASDADSGAMVGGANLIIFAPQGEGAPVTANLNYLYICPEQRGRGALRPFVTALAKLAATQFGPAPSVALFIEQNDPYRMSREAYEKDSAHSGMDQFVRLGIWARLGALVVDFPYVQPPLSDGQQADECLVYSVLGLTGPILDPLVLRHHLAGFFGVSVLKGAPLETAPVALAQLEALDALHDAGGAVALLDPAPYLAGLPAAPLEATPRPQSLRVALSSSIVS